MSLWDKCFLKATSDGSDSVAYASLSLSYNGWCCRHARMISYARSVHVGRQFTCNNYVVYSHRLHINPSNGCFSCCFCRRATYGFFRKTKRHLPTVKCDCPVTWLIYSDFKPQSSLERQHWSHCSKTKHLTQGRQKENVDFTETMWPQTAAYQCSWLCCLGSSSIARLLSLKIMYSPTASVSELLNGRNFHVSLITKASISMVSSCLQLTADTLNI